jgi:hypothetical protein
MGGERLFSLFFDLNQGMSVGAPGLMAGALAVSAFAQMKDPGRWGRAIAAALVFGVVISMALPTLIPHNWNAGTRAVLRYSYWLSMPLLALVLYGLPALGRTAAIALSAAALSLQLLSVALFGLAGKDDVYLSHNRIAAFVLAHAPGAYNPEAEIFYERTRGVEGAPAPGGVVVYRAAGSPRKLLRSWLDPGSTGGLCADGQELDAAGSTILRGGLQYLDAPFRCVRAGSSHRLGTWRFGKASPESRALLGGGWSGTERDGTWTEGAASRLRVPVRAGGKKPSRLLWMGHYYQGSRASLVRINGIDVGRHSLPGAAVDVPAEARGARILDVELRHPDAASPKSKGESPDSRLLGLFLTVLALDGEP